MIRESLGWPRRVALDFARNWTRFEQGWLVTFSLVTVWVFLALDDTFLGLFASLTGMLTVVLVAKGRIASFYFGIANVAAYGYIALGSQYYGEVMLNWGFFLPVQFVGLALWGRHMRTDRVVDAVRLTNRQRVSWGIAAVVAIAGYGAFLRWLQGSLPFVDATSTVLSVVAQVLLVLRATEQWLVWIVIDVVSIYMWLTVYRETGAGVAMVVMWTAYLVNACYGWYNWRRMASATRRRQATPAGVTADD